MNRSIFAKVAAAKATSKGDYTQGRQGSGRRAGVPGQGDG